MKHHRREAPDPIDVPIFLATTAPPSRAALDSRRRSSVMPLPVVRDVLRSAASSASVWMPLLPAVPTRHQRPDVRRHHRVAGRAVRRLRFAGPLTFFSARCLPCHRPARGPGVSITGFVIAGAPASLKNCCKRQQVRIRVGVGTRCGVPDPGPWTNPTSTRRCVFDHLVRDLVDHRRRGRISRNGFARSPSIGSTTGPVLLDRRDLDQPVPFVDRNRSSPCHPNDAGRGRYVISASV